MMGGERRTVLAFFVACGLACAVSLGPVHARPLEPSPTLGGPHDFDFEFGAWRCHLSRLLKPLTGSKNWVEYDGSSVVRKVWNGKANLGEIELDGAAGHIEGLSLRVYDPADRQWSVSFANGAQGQMGMPMIGGFQNGRGEFYDQETLNGRAIFVRFVFSDITAHSFKLEQAFSDDGGRSWEPNWLARFTR
jgi:hypothetical protein